MGRTASIRSAPPTIAKRSSILRRLLPRINLLWRGLRPSSTTDRWSCESRQARVRMHWLPWLWRTALVRAS